MARTVLFAAALCVSILPDVTAQDAARIAYVPTVSIAEDDETIRFARIINEAIQRELSLIGVELIQLDFDSEQSAMARAAELDARLIFQSSTLASGRELIMSFRATDVASGRVVDAAFVPTILGVTVLNRIDESVTIFAESLAEYLANPGEVASIAPFALTVTVNLSPEDTSIRLPSGDLVGVAEEGRLEFPFNPYPVGARLLLTKEREGYHTEIEPIELTRPVNTFTLNPLWKQTRWAVDAHTTLGQIAGLGVGGRYYFNPDIWFIGADGYYYYQVPASAAFDPVARVDLGLRTGRYFVYGYREPFRLGLGTGLGVILTRIRASERQLYTDFYLTFASLFAEYNSRSWFVFGRIDAKMGLGLGNGLLERRVLDVRTPSGSTVPMISIGVGRKL